MIFVYNPSVEKKHNCYHISKLILLSGLIPQLILRLAIQNKFRFGTKRGAWYWHIECIYMYIILLVFSLKS